MPGKDAKASTKVISIACAIATMLVFAGCAPARSDGPAASASEVHLDTSTMTWSAESDCASCHDTESLSMTDGACLASTHQVEGATCSTCHADETAMVKAHEDMTTAKPPKKLKKTEVAKEACLSCHSEEDIVSATADSTVCTDSRGKTVNPHQLPENEDHDAVRCGDCHAMHGGDSIEETAQAVCSSCHHQGVYECYTCHE